MSMNNYKGGRFRPRKVLNLRWSESWRQLVSPADLWVSVASLMNVDVSFYMITM